MQLRTSKDIIAVILRKIRNNELISHFMYALLVIISIMFVVLRILIHNFEREHIFVAVTEVIDGLLLVIFHSIFYCQLIKTNSRLALFFKELEDESFPKKTNFAVLTIFMLAANINHMALVFEYFELTDFKNNFAIIHFVTFVFYVICLQLL